MNLLAELLISLVLGFAVTVQGDERIPLPPWVRDGEGDERNSWPLWLLEAADYDGDESKNDLLAHTSLPTWKHIHPTSLLSSPFDIGRTSSAYDRFHPRQTYTSFKEDLDNTGTAHVRDIAGSVSHLSSRQPTRNTRYGAGMRPNRYDYLSRSTFPKPLQISQIPSKIHHSGHNAISSAQKQFIHHPVFSLSEADFGRPGIAREVSVEDSLASRRNPPSPISQVGKIGLGNILRKPPGHALEGAFEDIKEDANRFGERGHVITQAVNNTTKLSGHTLERAFEDIKEDANRFGKRGQVITQSVKNDTKLAGHTPEGAFEDIKEDANRFEKRGHAVAQAVKNATKYTKDIAGKTIEQIAEGLITFVDRMFNVEEYGKSINSTSHILHKIKNHLLRSILTEIDNVITQVARHRGLDQINATLKNFLDELKRSVDSKTENLSSQNSFFISRIRETSSSNSNPLHVLKSVVKELVPELVANYDDAVVQHSLNLFLEELLFYSNAYCDAKTSGITQVPQRDIMLYRNYIRNKMDQIMNSW